VTYSLSKTKIRYCRHAIKKTVAKYHQFLKFTSVNENTVGLQSFFPVFNASVYSSTQVQNIDTFSHNANHEHASVRFKY